MRSAMPVVVKVPTSKASAPKLASLPGAGLGIQRGLLKKCHQSSFGTMGAASRKMKRKIAAMPMMLLQPQRRMSHSVGFSIESKRLKRLFFGADAVAMILGCLCRVPGAGPGRGRGGG